MHLNRVQKGFTLIELMVVVAIVGILASVAYPSYVDHVRKGRRAEAQATLMDISLKQGQYFVQRKAYAADATELGITIPTSVSSYYDVDTAGAAGTPPTFTATATPKGDQTKDKCGTLGIDQTGAKTAASGETGCW